jgi:hypothetical protein
MERFELKQVAKNDPEAIGTAVITTASLSGTDAQKDAFVSSLGADWEPIPEELLSGQNFINFARACEGGNQK